LSEAGEADAQRRLDRQILLFVALYAAGFVAVGFCLDSPDRIGAGLVRIIGSRDTQ